MRRKGAKPARRKPKQERSQETLQAILDAAARVLARLGYARATTNRIAEAAGVSVGTLYEYYANKDEVFEALIQRELGLLSTAFAEQRRERDVPLESAIRAHLTAGMRAMRHGPELFRALEAVPDAVFRKHLAASRKGVTRLVRQLLETHRSELRVRDLDLAAFVVVSAVEGVGANATRRDLGGALADELTTLLTRYLVD
ncbi:MAG: TetR/AcrR family transcriptional regulator [Myxococcota bacterium]